VLLVFRKFASVEILLQYNEILNTSYISSYYAVSIICMVSALDITHLHIFYTCGYSHLHWSMITLIMFPLQYMARLSDMH